MNPVKGFDAAQWIQFFDTVWIKTDSVAANQIAKRQDFLPNFAERLILKRMEVISGGAGVEYSSMELLTKESKLGPRLDLSH